MDNHQSMSIVSDISVERDAMQFVDDVCAEFEEIVYTLAESRAQKNHPETPLIITKSDVEEVIKYVRTALTDAKLKDVDFEDRFRRQFCRAFQNGVE